MNICIYMDGRNHRISHNAGYFYMTFDELVCIFCIFYLRTTKTKELNSYEFPFLMMTIAIVMVKRSKRSSMPIEIK